MNLANKITLARIFLVPIIMFFLLVNLKTPHIRIEQFTITYNQIVAALIFIVAASTDSLDGYIARKHKLVTNLAKHFFTNIHSIISQKKNRNKGYSFATVLPLILLYNNLWMIYKR